MKRQLIFVLAIVMVASLVPVCEADPVQWRTKDGGNGHYYEVIDMGTLDNWLTWEEAKAAAEAASCLGVPGHLATITSAEEEQFIIDNLLPPYGSWALGGHQPVNPETAPDEGWEWITGEPWVYTNWQWAEPWSPPGVDEDTLNLAHRGAPGNKIWGWQDIEYTTKDNGYIIEYPVCEPACWTEVFFDDYDAVWDATPVPQGVLASYIGVPNVSGGVARGIGSGYTPPLYTWMVKPVAFTAETLEVTLRGQSGPSWPNLAEIKLMDASWGGHGQQEIGYGFRIYGESSNYRFVIYKYGPGYTELANYNIGSTITDWHTYVVSRDASGNWALTMDDVTQSPSFMTPDLSYTDFTYIGSFLYRNQSALDYVEVKVPCEPAGIEVAVDLDPDFFEVKVKEPKEPKDPKKPKKVKKPKEPKEESLEAFIEFPADANVADVDVNTVTLSLNGATLATAELPVIVDNILDILFPLDPNNVGTILGLEVTKVKVHGGKIKVETTAVPSQPIDLIELTVSGELMGGGRFSGTDAVRVMLKKHHGD